MTRPIVVILCEHGEAKYHLIDGLIVNGSCPGGRVLQQAIIIERDTDGEWPKAIQEALGSAVVKEVQQKHMRPRVVLDALASAQENQR